MTKLRVVVLLAVVALLLVPAFAYAQTPPQPPCRFYGTVTVDGAAVPAGTIITATVAGDVALVMTLCRSFRLHTAAVHRQHAAAGERDKIGAQQQHKRRQLLALAKTPDGLVLGQEVLNHGRLILLFL